MEDAKLKTQLAVGVDEKYYNLYFAIIPDFEYVALAPTLHASSLTNDKFVNEWVNTNRACLIKGAVKHWPAITKWKNKSYWQSHCADFEVDAFLSQNFIDHRKQQRGRLTLSYHQAIERLFSGIDPVFSIPSEEITSTNRFAGIVEDIGDFGFLPNPPAPRWYQKMRFFSYRNSATAWHYHNVDETLMCQVNGTKRVLLLPPDIPSVDYVTDFFLKEKYLDGEALNNYLRLKPLVAEVEEGDALYIPPYWHHVVVPVGNEVGFTLAYCWASPLHILGNVFNYFVRRLYAEALRPFSIKSAAIPLVALSAIAAYIKRKVINWVGRSN